MNEIDPLKLRQAFAKMQNDIKVLQEHITALTEENRVLRNDLKGIETALLGKELLNKDGLELHQSFDHEEITKAQTSSD